MTLASRLLLLIALALTPPLLFGILNDVTQRNQRAAALDESALAEGRSLQDSMTLVTDGVHRLLVAMAEAPVMRSGDLAGCTRYLRAIAGQLREYSLLAMVDTDGSLLCNDTGGPRGSYSVADRAYFKRAMQTGQFVSGDLVTGISTHRRSLHFAMPLKAMDGTRAGIVIASIDQDWLSAQLAMQAVPPGSESILLDPGGNVVAAAQDGVPIDADWIGQLAPSALRNALAVTRAQVVNAEGPDGMMRMFGAVPANPALAGNTVVVGIDRERAFADLRAASARNLIGLGLGGLVALLAGIVSARRFVLGPLAQIAAAADRVGAGDLNARADLGRRSGEMREFGAGFDRMIYALANREDERDVAETALRESEARFQAIVDCIDQIVWSSRPDGVPDYFNQRWYAFTGTTPAGTSPTGTISEALDGDQWLGLTHPDDRGETTRAWQASLDTGSPFHREHRLQHVSGRFRWVLSRAQAVRGPGPDGEDRIIRWYGTCTDIDELVQAREVLARSREVLAREVAERTTELMQAEEQLRQSQKMEAVGQLTGGIAHDFNNMLQAIGGSLELLVRRVDQNKLDDARRFAGIARATVDRAAALTHRLLAFARRQTLSPEPVDPAALIDGMSELVARTVGRVIDVTIDRHADQNGSAWNVLCDLSQLENIVFNLCINARDAMPDGGKLTIGLRNVAIGPAELAQTEGAAAGDYVEIAVADTGTGMDEATQTRAFEPFFTTKPVGQGTGLGLSQVYGFVRQSGGFVRLQSELGAGTTVRLFLPRHTGGSSAPDGSLDASVLLIESDPVIRASAAKQLRALGHIVRESDGAGDVMRMLAGGTPIRLLVTGVGLPGNLNGRQVAEAARARWPALPVLFITSYAGSLAQGELADCMLAMAAPIDPAELRRLVSSLLVEAVPTPA